MVRNPEFVTTGFSCQVGTNGLIDPCGCELYVKGQLIGGYEHCVREGCNHTVENHYAPSDRKKKK